VQFFSTQVSLAQNWNPSETGLKTIEPLVESAFDAGGAFTLTRATQDTSSFSNPALPALGSGIFRSINYRMGTLAGTESFQFLRNSIRNKEKIASTLKNSVLSGGPPVPILYGPFFNFGLNTRFFGFTLFAKSQLMLNKEVAPAGSLLPLQTRTRSYALGGISANVSFPLSSVFNFGISARKLGLYSLFGVLNPAEVLQSKFNIAANQPLVLDVGTLFAKRTSVFDVYLAGVLNDLGDTKARNSESIWKQTLNSGIGFALHTKSSALHCGFDWKDIFKAYNLDRLDSYFYGCKAVLTPIVGVSVGSRFQKLSAGFSLNLFVTRLEIAYTHRIVPQGLTASGLLIPRISTPTLLFSLGSEIP
jgi:hypothetical protein